MADTLYGLLVTAEGAVVRGLGGGAQGTAVGELVFQTGMVGYQEALTDPSYAGQILIFTYPLVGSYGTGALAGQSSRVHARAAIMRDMMSSAGHRDSSGDLNAFLQDEGTPALYGVDTRSLVKQVRLHGVLPAALAVATQGRLPDVAELQKLAQSLDYDCVDYVVECSTPELTWHPQSRPEAPRVALLDYGAKKGMLERLQHAGAGVWLVPSTMTAGEVMALQPDGVLVSNGPGDPAHLGYAVETVRGLMEQGQLPVFGICLGHQLIALAAGGRTTKMRFGHRGINQPVLETATGRMSITTQNHGYTVDPASLPPDFYITHTNLNDGTVEGLAHRSRPIWGVQWHPEAFPGPTDTHGLIESFLAAASNAAVEGTHA
ncbi:MAG: glutamine-hydrolyzing carbamoyl-phosphate synthase small subunit [Chloroflexi bacterium]|nr:glutamine-hydrolyzing carbamoyl-phosphate synthase small subunit [Chloroflexota bacterium]